MSVSYKDAGVDIEAGDELIQKIKPYIKATHNDKVLSNIGLFGGFYEADFSNYKSPVLVASTDGVGTKLKIAFIANKHDTVGQCLVNHCTNDILCCGAKPLFFLDYFATGKLNVDVAAKVIQGFAQGCLENDCALIGGETAEMPSIYKDEEYDVSGTIVGIVSKEKVVNGEQISHGDILIGLPSTGLHTNGYSLARKVLLDKYEINEYINELKSTLAEALLAIHKSYLKPVLPLVEAELLTGISHITGGGIIGNTKRIMPKDCEMKINWGSWEIPPIFNLIQKAGEISDEEMRKAFNMGIGMILVIKPSNFDKVFSLLKEENPIVVGEIIAK
ncbi:MAG: phosphoribosylformylglycinamidine cyclo-ligase [bacterium]